MSHFELQPPWYCLVCFNILMQWWIIYLWNYQVFLCFGNSVASTRFMLQDEFNIQTTRCDNCIIVNSLSLSPSSPFYWIWSESVRYFVTHLFLLCRVLCSASNKLLAYFQLLLWLLEVRRSRKLLSCCHVCLTWSTARKLLYIRSIPGHYLHV